MSKNHAMEMFQKGDEGHLKAGNKMQELMKSPEALNEWMGNKRKEFDNLPAQ
ncbi:MAG: hypothetical protein ABJP45_02305 [Cyclobacteriaceae bacterium]